MRFLSGWKTTVGKHSDKTPMLHYAPVFDSEPGTVVHLVDCIKHPSLGMAWRPAAAWRPAMSPAWWRWLASRDSLTRRLSDASAGELSVRLMAQGFTLPRRDEALKLATPLKQYVWYREVALCTAGRPWVMARSVAPLAKIKGQRLGRLGERSLGSWLFRQPDIHRGPIDISRQALCADHPPGPWTRRSLFMHERFEILVQEFFLAHMADELGLPSR